MITAMTLLIILMTLFVVAAAEALLVIHDGPGPLRPPASRFDDPQLHPPGWQ